MVAETGGHEVPYQYDPNGLRVSKMVDGVLREYYYYGNLLMYETMPSPCTDDALSRIEYAYDESGSQTEIRYFNGLINPIRYYDAMLGRFIYTMQGDTVYDKI